MLVYQVYNQETLLARSDIRPNTELLHLVIQNSIEKLIPNLPEGAPVVVAVHFPGYEWFIYHRIIEILADSGYSVSHNMQDENTTATFLEVGVEGFGIDYTSGKRGSLFRAKRISRRATGVFSFRVTYGNSEQVIRVSEQVSDTIPYSKREEVENRALPFTQGDVPDGSITDRYLGPAVIITATGIVVYLFFSIRS
jgi:hypothetical protein